MSLSVRVFQQRKLLDEFEEKHKLGQLSSFQSNLDCGSFDAQGQEMREVVRAAAHSRALCSSNKHLQILM